jgi:nucleotide-binding universal stress UspA family protein
LDGSGQFRKESIVVTDKSYKAILRIARERDADLIVLGVQGRGVLDRMFFGSTTNHVIRQATCPVLTIRT